MFKRRKQMSRVDRVRSVVWPVFQIEKQRKGPGISDKGAEQAGQKVATADISHEQAYQHMQSDEGREGNRNAPCLSLIHI